MANVRETSRQLSERNIGAVLFAGSETGGDMLNTHGGSLEAVAQAIDTVLAAGKEFGLPVAMTSTTNMIQRIEQGARLVHGRCDARAAEGSEPLGGDGSLSRATERRVSGTALSPARDGGATLRLIVIAPVHREGPPE